MSFAYFTVSPFLLCISACRLSEAIQRLVLYFLKRKTQYVVYKLVFLFSNTEICILTSSKERRRRKKLQSWVELSLVRPKSLINFYKTDETRQKKCLVRGYHLYSSTMIFFFCFFEFTRVVHVCTILFFFIYFEFRRHLEHLWTCFMEELMFYGIE